MRFEGKQHEPHRAALPFDGAKETLTLDRKRSRIVVRFSVNEKNGSFYFVGKRKRGQVVINLRGLPVGALFILKSEGRQRAVVSAAARDSGLEQIAVRQ